jgi:hypothetical protein
VDNTTLNWETFSLALAISQLPLHDCDHAFWASSQWKSKITFIS